MKHRAFEIARILAESELNAFIGYGLFRAVGRSRGFITKYGETRSIYQAAKKKKKNDS